MKFAAIARPPVVFGKVRTFNADKAMAVSGVEQVIELPAAEAPAMFKALGGIAVIASNSWAALHGRDLLDIEWDDGANADYDSARYKQALLETVRKPGTVPAERGQTWITPWASATTLEAEYYAPHLAHASMEPPAAVASVTADFCEIWAPTQNPQSLIPMAEKVTGFKPEQIKVNVTLLGGAFGRKSKCDFVEEAVLLPKNSLHLYWCNGAGKTISGMIITTRSARSSCLPASMTRAGHGWRHRLAYPSIMSTFDPSVKRPARWNWAGAYEPALPDRKPEY